MSNFNPRYHRFMWKNADFFMKVMDDPEFLEIIKERLKEKKENEKDHHDRETLRTSVENPG